jgi:hypothetical protein
MEVSLLALEAMELEFRRLLAALSSVITYWTEDFRVA